MSGGPEQVAPELRVLVVDDEPLTAAGHAEYVARVRGFRVVATVGTARDAVGALGKEEVDLVLLDLNLPDGHGLEIARSVRASGRAIDLLPITAARETELVRLAVSLGVVGYLLKPFTFADLRERLDAYRHYRDELGGSADSNQGRIDSMLARLHHPVVTGAIPAKGLSPQLLDQVIDVLRDRAGQEGLSASDVAGHVGTSRVTARRYLQRLVDQGAAVRSHRLGGTGRPEVVFRWRLDP